MGFSPIGRVEQSAARQVHTLEVTGSSPVSATTVQDFPFLYHERTEHPVGRSGAFAYSLFPEVVTLNDSNLIPNSERTPSELREMARKGGKASGISRSFSALWKKRVREHPELLEQLLDNLLEMAMNNDAKAYALLMEMGGESVRSQELALRKQELKLKKQQMQNSAPGEQELPALWNALSEEDDA